MSNQIKVYATDDIMQKDTPATAGSKILEGFKSPFDAAVVKKLNEAGLKIEKSLTMDEFGIDDFFDDSFAEEETLAAVSEAAADENICVLSNDVFGKVRRQAVLHGVSYIKPTYGTVSRYGLIPAVSSMDQIGVVCADLQKGFEVLSKIYGADGLKTPDFRIPSPCQMCAKGVCDVRVTIPVNVWDKTNENIVSKLKDSFETSEINLEHFEVYHQVLYILSSAEISNNTNRYDGIKFGYRSPNSNSLNDLYFNTRSEGFTLNTKLALVMGSSVLSKENYADYYEKAMKIRRLIKDSVKFDSYDVIALPVEMKEKTKYEQSALYALTALTGLPSITVPYGDSGIQFVANTGREDVLVKLAARLNSPQ